LASRLPRKIQILDENGENIVLMTNGDDSDDDSDDEDREFTVIVEDMEEEEAKKLVRYESYLYFLICSPLISRNFCIFTLFSINTNRYLPFCRYGRYIDRYWVPI